MPGWIESRGQMLEQRVEYLLRLINDLRQQIQNALQQARNAQSNYSTVGPGAGNGQFFCQPSSGVSGASGTWPSITPVSFTADIYQAGGSSITLLTSGATVYNWYAASFVAGKTVYVQPDGTGSYVAIAQSCT